MTAQTAPVRPALDVAMPMQSTSMVDKARTVQKLYGKTTGRQTLEFMRLALGPGKLTTNEYYSMRLFDDAALMGADKRDYLGLAGIQRVIGSIQGTSSWLGPLNDKIAFAALLGGLGLPVPRIKAVYAEKGRVSACATLLDEDSLVAFLCDPANYPMFSKPVSGTLGVGATSWVSFDPATGCMVPAAGPAVPVRQLAATIVEAYSASGYQFQEQLMPHSAIRDVCGDRLATVRVVTTSHPKVSILGAEWKIPAGANMVDNFKHPGNVLAGLDIETGSVRRAIRGTGLDQEDITAHPDTGRGLIGFQLPHWQMMLETVTRAARVCAGVPVIGWDVAMTDAGCVLLEANTRPDLRGLQTVTGRGFYPVLKQVQTDVRATQRAYKVGQRREARELKRKNIAMAMDGHAPDV